MAAAKPIRSMTGFALAARNTAAGELTISLRTVNHRGLDLHFHQAHEFSPFENGMRSLLKESVGRGHVEIRAGLQRNGGERGGLNTAALKQYVQAFQQAAASLGIDNKPDLNTLLTLPGVIEQSANTPDLGSDFERILLEALKECVGSLNQCREREGGKLAAQMLMELIEIEQATNDIRTLRDTALPSFQRRLREKLRDLLNGSGVAEARIVEECAILADRSDIQEELTRLSVHALELRRILDGGGAMGKQIDFLLQEMNREANTILAKSSTSGDAGLKITGHGLALKANIERIREQALNLE